MPSMPDHWTTTASSTTFTTGGTITSNIWPQWVQAQRQLQTMIGQPITASTSTTATINQIWTVWNANLALTGSATTTTGTIINAWGNWNATLDHRIVQAVDAAAQRRTTAEYERQVREYRAREDKRVAEVDAAKRRARELLMRNLTEEQRKDLEIKKCFYLESISKDGQRRRYRIDQGTHGNVKLLDKDGRIIGSYCVQPNGVPAEDAMLAQKLWLETDEQAFVKAANFTRHAA